MRARSVLLTFAAALACAQSNPTPAEPEGPRAPVAAPVTPAPRPATITVLAEAPGRGPSQVELEVTTPLETALVGVPGVARVRSESRVDAATIVLTLERSADVEATRAAVHVQLGAAGRSLPPGVTPAIVAELEPPDLRFVLSGELAGTQLRALAGALRDGLVATPGVGRVELCGGRDEALQVTVDPARLAAHALAIDAVTGALSVELGGGPRVVGLNANPTTIEALSAVMLKPGVRVRDVASVALVATVPQCDAASVGGGPVVIGTVLARRGAGGEPFVAALRDRLAALQQGLPAGVKLEVLGASQGRVALELIGGAAPRETVQRAAAALVPALVAMKDRRVMIASPVPRAAGSRVDAEIVLERIDAAELPALARALATVAGVRVRAIDGDVEELARVVVIGDELAVAERLAGELAALAGRQPGVHSAAARTARVSELEMELDGERLAALGLSRAALAVALAAALDGVEVGALRGGARTPVRVHLGEATPADPSALAALSIVTPGGATPLSALVTLRAAERPDSITRIDLRRAVEVELELAGPDARAAVERAMAAELRLPAGYVVRFE